MVRMMLFLVRFAWPLITRRMGSGIVSTHPLQTHARERRKSLRRCEDQGMIPLCSSRPSRVISPDLMSLRSDKVYKVEKIRSTSLVAA